MLMSKLLGVRFKEKPSEATSVSHIFLLRGGYMRQVTNGSYTLMMPAKRVVDKIEKIIRDEMDSIDGQEVLFPVVLPGDLWRESGRFDAVGSELVRLKDRAGKDLVLGMTHEEAAVHLARTEAKSYADYPFMIYQLQTKFRDEPRARGGLIRVREFTMKDAYSFHTSQEDLEDYYQKCYDSYHRIYAKAGVPEVISVQSDTGMMGGKVAHEFMLLTDIGEDTLVICDSCDYQSNMEVATCKLPVATTEETTLEEVATPGAHTIEEVAKFLNVDASKTLKACVFQVDGKKEPLIVFIRGDLNVNEAKLTKITKAEVAPFEDYENAKNLVFGYMGPYNLDKGNATVIFDESLRNEKNLVVGANKEGYHLKGLSVSRDLNVEEFHDVAEVVEGATCPCCNGKVHFKRGVEVGNIFQLGTRYTESMGMTYIDKDGKAKTPIMGCYGIGVGRLLACIIEAKHDDWGPIWPISVAPWQVHVCVLKSKKQDMNVPGMDIYNRLNKKFETIVDDRDISAGAQFADADLLGVPVRVVVGEKNLANGEVELVTRDKSIKKLVKIEDIETEVQAVVDELYARINAEVK